MVKLYNVEQKYGRFVIAEIDGSGFATISLELWVIKNFYYFYLIDFFNVQSLLKIKSFLFWKIFEIVPKLLTGKFLV